jgi:hypothetical protein
MRSERTLRKYLHDAKIIAKTIKDREEKERMYVFIRTIEWCLGKETFALTTMNLDCEEGEI